MTQFFVSKLIATVGGRRFATLAACTTLALLGMGQNAQVQAQGQYQATGEIQAASGGTYTFHVEYNAAGGGAGGGDPDWRNAGNSPVVMNEQAHPQMPGISNYTGTVTGLNPYVLYRARVRKGLVWQGEWQYFSIIP